MKLGRV